MLKLLPTASANWSSLPCAILAAIIDFWKTKTIKKFDNRKINNRLTSLEATCKHTWKSYVSHHDVFLVHDVGDTVKHGIRHKECHQRKERNDSDCSSKATCISIVVVNTAGCNPSLIRDAAEHNHCTQLHIQHGSQSIDWLSQDFMDTQSKIVHFGMAVSHQSLSLVLRKQTLHKQSNKHKTGYSVYKKHKLVITAAGAWIAKYWLLWSVAGVIDSLNGRLKIAGVWFLHSSRCVVYTDRQIIQCPPRPYYFRYR